MKLKRYLLPLLLLELLVASPEVDDPLRCWSEEDPNTKKENMICQSLSTETILIKKLPSNQTKEIPPLETVIIDLDPKDFLYEYEWITPEGKTKKFQKVVPILNYTGLDIKIDPTEVIFTIRKKNHIDILFYDDQNKNLKNESLNPRRMSITIPYEPEKEFSINFVNKHVQLGLTSDSLIENL